MKINKLLITLLAVLLSCRSDDDGHAKKEELKNIVLDYYNALAAKDLAKANSLTTPDFVLWDEGIIYNNEKAVKEVEQMKQFTVKFALDSMNAHVDKRNASAYYFRSADFVISDTVYPTMKFLESATFNKEDGKWKLRFIHSSMRK